MFVMNFPNDLSADLFSLQLLKIKNGRVSVNNLTGLITLIKRTSKSKEQLLENIFPNILQRYKNHDLLSDLAIWTATILRNIEGENIS